MSIITDIMNALNEMRFESRVSCIETALCSKGYAFYVLELDNQIRAHTKRHNTVSVDIIIDSFVNQIEQTKTIKQAFKNQRGES